MTRAAAPAPLVDRAVPRMAADPRARPALRAFLDWVRARDPERRRLPKLDDGAVLAAWVREAAARTALGTARARVATPTAAAPFLAAYNAERDAQARALADLAADHGVPLAEAPRWRLLR